MTAIFKTLGGPDRGGGNGGHDPNLETHFGSLIRAIQTKETVIHVAAAIPDIQVSASPPQISVAAPNVVVTPRIEISPTPVSIAIGGLKPKHIFLAALMPSVAILADTVARIIWR